MWTDNDLGFFTVRRVKENALPDLQVHSAAEQPA
jgi:hypothetical protein